jgi:hypothetical protein
MKKVNLKMMHDLNDKEMNVLLEGLKKWISIIENARKQDL